MRSIPNFQTISTSVLAAVGMAIVAQAQENLEIHFILSGKALSCFLEHRSTYLETLGETAFIVPEKCPDGVSSDIADVLVAEGPTPPQELASAPGAEDAWIFLSTDEFECLAKKASAISIEPDTLYSFKPEACVLEASE